MTKDKTELNDMSVEEVVNQALDDSVDNMSMGLRRNLNKIRIEATEPKAKYFPVWKTATTFSFMLTVVIAWQLLPSQTEVPLTPFAEVLEEDLDMLNDLEFAYWMAEETDNATL
ncbi:MAG: hypothetical protein COA74_03515 [Gammaproteobacteria bacterium]|nr:MAG: hypothetical protein COA74_03515 [Gammaproteobacteria bacterium]